MLQNEQIALETFQLIDVKTRPFHHPNLVLNESVLESLEMNFLKMPENLFPMKKYAQQEWYQDIHEQSQIRPQPVFQKEAVDTAIVWSFPQHGDRVQSDDVLFHLSLSQTEQMLPIHETEQDQDEVWMPLFSWLLSERQIRHETQKDQHLMPDEYRDKTNQFPNKSVHR